MIADLILRVEMTFAQCPLLYHDEEYGHKDKDVNGRGTNPAEVFRRISPWNAPCCLRPKSESSAFGLQYFRGHMGSLALRPGGSLTILFRWLCQ